MGQILKKINYWGPPLLWAVVIFLFSSMPTLQSTQVYWQDFAVKKTAHFTEYAIFTVLLYRAFLSEGLPKSKCLLFAFVIAIVYALTDEFHQSFTPGREPRLRDVGFDTIGAAAAVWTLKNLSQIVPNQLKKLVESLDLL